MTEEEIKQIYAELSSIFGNILYQLHQDNQKEIFDAYKNNLEFFMLRVVLQRISYNYNITNEKIIEVVQGWLKILDESKELEQELYRMAA